MRNVLLALVVGYVIGAKSGGKELDEHRVARVRSLVDPD
jgi:hypothetical protein